MQSRFAALFYLFAAAAWTGASLVSTRFTALTWGLAALNLVLGLVQLRQARRQARAPEPPVK